MRRRALLAASMDGNNEGSNEGPIDINNYLTIEALGDNLIVEVYGYVGNYEYCIDGDGYWKRKVTNTSILITAGQRISFRANTTTRLITEIKCAGSRYNLIGNCMSIIFGDNAANSFSLIGYDYAFESLFQNQQNLVSVSPSFLPATTLAKGCYRFMFLGCTNLTTAPELPATTLSEKCYISMFDNCNKLNYIKMLATDISAYDCLNRWVEGVSSTGTFVKNPAMTTLPTGISGIPSEWTVVNDGEE